MLNLPNVGIGTATPAATLSIKQSGAQIDCSTSATDVTFEAIDRSATTNAINTRWYTRNGEFQWNNSSYSRAMTLDASGNLGVGATSPLAKLHVVGTSGAAALFLRGADPSTQTAAAYIKTPVSTGYSETPIYGFWYQNCGISNPALETIGFVTNSARVLTIDGSGNALFKTNGTASAPTIANADNPDTGLYWPTDSDTLALAVGGSDAVYIDSSRRVGIGIIPATSQLHVAFSSSSTAGLIEANSAKVENTNTTANNLSGLFLSQSGDAGCGIAAVHTSRTGGSRTSDLALYSYAQAVSASPTERLRIKSTGQLNFTGLSADPTGAAGDLYYNSVEKGAKLHNGTAWRKVPLRFQGRLASDGAAPASSFVVTHSLEAQHVSVQVAQANSPYAVVYTDIELTSATTATIKFASNVTGYDYIVTIIG